MRKTETWTSGTGQKLLVHAKETCSGEFCCIHNPSQHHMSDWPLHYRNDRGIMERICKCGVGHPDPDDLAFRRSTAVALKLLGKTGTFDEGVHGCCGCCTPPEDK